MATPITPPSPAPAHAPPQVVRAGKGETLLALAQKHFRDDRAADLLLQFNPGLPRQGSIPDGTVVQIPSKAAAASWAGKKGITLGVDPNRPSGTRQKRAWNAFKSGPTNRPVTAPAAQVGPDAALLGVLGIHGVDTLGPGLLAAPVLRDPAQLAEAVGQRFHWVGAPRVLSAAAVASPAVLQQKAARAAQVAGVPNATPHIESAVHRVLWDAVTQEVLRDARTLLARAQQALAATAAQPQGSQQLVLALADAHPDTATRVLITLGVPRAEGAPALERLSMLGTARAAAAAAAPRSGPQRVAALQAAGLPPGVAQALAPRLGQQALAGLALDLSILSALDLDGVAARIQQGVTAMLALIQRAAPQLAQLPPAGAVAHLHAARTAALGRLGSALASLEPDEWPSHTPTHTLDAALAAVGAPSMAGATPLVDTVRVAWRAVEALGARLLEVDASTLGQGIGALTARVAPRESAQERAQDVKRMRSGAVAALGSKAAVRAQTGVEAQRALVPHALMLAVVDHFPFAATAAPAAARTEYRRRLVDGMRTHYAVAPGTPRPNLSATALREDLDTLLGNAALSAGRDDQDRIRRVQAALQQPALVGALAGALDRVHGKFRREELTLGALVLLAGAWLLEHARGLPDPASAAAAVTALCQEEGGRILDAMERDLLRRLG